MITGRAQQLGRGSRQDSRQAPQGSQNHITNIWGCRVPWNRLGVGQKRLGEREKLVQGGIKGNTRKGVISVCRLRKAVTLHPTVYSFQEDSTEPATACSSDREKSGRQESRGNVPQQPTAGKWKTVHLRRHQSLLLIRVAGGDHQDQHLFFKLGVLEVK